MWKPCCSIAWMIGPVCSPFTASGLMIAKVCSIAMSVSPGVLRARHPRHEGLGELGRARADRHAGLGQRRDLRGRRALAARDDRARVAHALARGRGLAGDERGERLLEVGADPGGRVFFGLTADL